MFPRAHPLAYFLPISLCLLLALSAHADDALIRVRSHGTLRIATDATYPPFEYMEKDQIVGFDQDIAQELGRELGVKAEMISMEWSGVFASLETGQCDLVMSGVTITAERKKGNAFSRPYFLSGQVIARRKDHPEIKTPEDIIRGTGFVAVQQETTGQFAMDKRGMPKSREHRFDTLPDALLDVRNNNSVAAVGDLPALADLIRKSYPEIEVVPGAPFVEENLGIVARRDGRDLIAAVNDALAHMMVDGRYARIYEKWTHQPLTLADLAKLEAVKNDGTAIPAAIAAQVKKPATPLSASNEAKSEGGSSLTIRFDVIRQALPALLRGAGMTLVLTVTTLLIGVPCGLCIALLRLTRVAPVRALATFYVEVIRGTPLLMQIYVIYFIFPALGIHFNPFAAGLAALSFNSAAYVAEIFRAGIESIDNGQREAAHALGMSNAQTMRFVILPQTIRRVLPPLTNEAVALLKDSSLVSVVSLSELMRVGKEFATTAGAPTTIYLAVAVLYLVMTLPLTSLVRYLEQRWQPISTPQEAK